MNKSHLLINEMTLQVLPSLAIAVGLNEAIALQQVHYWLNNTKNAGRIDEAGNKWVYNTYEEWREDNFPFWSVDKIQRVFASLKEQGVLIIQQLDAKHRDMKNFYRIDYEKLDNIGLSITQISNMDSGKTESSIPSKVHDVKMNQRIPENTITGIEASMFQDRPTAQEDIDPLRNQTLALLAFEEAFKVENGNIAWFKAKPEWTRLRKKLVDAHLKDNNYFKKYVVWYNEQGKFKGGMNVQQMRRDPDGFVLAMNLFEADNTAKPEEMTRLL